MKTIIDFEKEIIVSIPRNGETKSISFEEALIGKRTNKKEDLLDLYYHFYLAEVEIPETYKGIGTLVYNLGNKQFYKYLSENFKKIKIIATTNQKQGYLEFVEYDGPRFI